MTGFKDIEAIFLDIDGTLVSFKTHRVPQSTIDAVHRLRGLGVKVFIATGRPLPFVDNLGTLEYDGIMTVNGASCKVREQGEFYSQGAGSREQGEFLTVQHRPIDQEDLKHLVEYHRVHPFPIVFASDSETFITSISDSSREVLDLLDIKCPKVAPIEHYKDMDVMQLVAFFTEEEEPYIIDKVMPHSAAHRWHAAFADVICKGSSKQDGVDAIIRHYGIPLSHTMAFGDGGNDVGMLQHVGFGYAMGNAKPSVLEAAPYTTDSVDNDGVAKILNKVIAAQVHPL